MAQIQPLGASTFDRAIHSATTPVLVDFYASWCPPCRALALHLEKLVGEFEGRIAFFKVNVDEEPELAARFQVSAVPSLQLFAGGEAIYDIPGYVPESKLRTFLESVARAGSGLAFSQD